MTTDADAQPGSKARAEAEYRPIILWSALLVTILVVVGYFCISTAAQYRHRDAQRLEAQMDSNAPEAGYTQAGQALSSTAQPGDVQIGAYVVRIVDLSIADDTWTADFYVWFNWADSSLAPGDTFEVVNGEITSREKQAEWVHDNQHYAAYRVMAKITQFFDVSRFPVDDYLLAVEIEDGASTLDQMRYVTDDKNSGVSPQVYIPGFGIHRVVTVAKPHTYNTTFGDPRLTDGPTSAYSQFRFGIWLARNDWEVYVKVFLGMIAAVLVALVSFLIKPSHMDARFSVRVGAFFGAIANTVATSSLIPDTNVFTLTEMINGVALVIILLSLVQQTISLHMYHTRGEESLAPLLDQISLPLLAVGFVAICAAIPLVAAL